MREPAGDPTLGQAPVMMPDREAPGPRHWCDEVGSTLECPAEECPLGCFDALGDGDEGDGEADAGV